MKNTVLNVLLLTIYSGIIYSQELVTELNGFKLKQYKEVVKNELGEPIQVKNFDDGFQSEIYLIKPDSSAYMIFEYPNWNNEIIFSIQLYSANEEIDPKFKELKMGISEKEIIDKIGQPTNEKDIGEYGKMMEYESTNYSLEINPFGRLSSIKILDNSRELYPDPKVEKIPTFNQIKNILKSNNNETISEILSPELELYIDGKTHFFSYSWETEITLDKSGIFKLIRGISKNLEEIDITKESEYEENMRVELGKDIKHVLKFKKGNLKEIVLKWEDGKYKIWEIKS